MTQIHVIRSSSSKIDFEALAKSNETLFRAAIHPNGEFIANKKIYVGQWYVQHLDIGTYRIVHNLNTNFYGVSAGKHNTDEALTIETSNLDDISFTVKIAKDGEPVDRAFEFAVNIYG